jgi:hypothetical protein
MTKITDTQARMIRNMAEDGVKSADEYVKEIGLPISKIKYHAKKLGVELPLERGRSGRKPKKKTARHPKGESVVKAGPGIETFNDGVNDCQDGKSSQLVEKSPLQICLANDGKVLIRRPNCGQAVEIVGA